MTRTDFKIIVDLTHVFRDARKFTLVYIDSTKIWHIKQLQDHLIELFKIPEPFHLLSTGKTYLPPSEDVRILDPNDTVTVIQGTGLNDNGFAEITKSYVTTNATCNTTNGSETGDILNGTSRTSVRSDCDNSSVQIISNSRDEKSFKSFNKSTNSVSGTTTNQTLYHTIIDDSTTLDSSSKVEDVNSTKESTGIGEPNLSSKKKRVRHRKKKFNNSSDQDSNVAKKPRIVSNVSVPSGKHIRFDAPDNDSDSSVNDNDNADRSTLSNLSGFARKTPMKNLDNLLALRSTSTPLTFTHRKTEIEPEKTKVKEASLVSLTEEPMSTSESKDQSVKMINGSSNKSNQSTEVEKHGAQVKAGDIVDFKILKIGPDYTPIISNTITAEVLSVSEDSKSYELKITSGKGETQGPNGKFALPDDSNVTESETVHYSRKDMLELQIIGSA